MTYEEKAADIRFPLRLVKEMRVPNNRDPDNFLSLWRQEVYRRCSGWHNNNTFTWPGARGVAGYTEAHACA
jgi:hypothetical protein